MMWGSKVNWRMLMTNEKPKDAEYIENDGTYWKNEKGIWFWWNGHWGWCPFIGLVNYRLLDKLRKL